MEPNGTAEDQVEPRKLEVETYSWKLKSTDRFKAEAETKTYYWMRSNQVTNIDNQTYKSYKMV